MITSLRLSTRSFRRNPPISELAVNEVIKEMFVKSYITAATGNNTGAFDQRNDVAFTQRVCNNTTFVEVSARRLGWERQNRRHHHH